MIDKREKLLEQVTVLRAQMGERAAFNSLVRKYNNRLVFFVRRLVNDDDVSKDVVQNVWVTVYHTLRSLKNLNAFTTWLYRIARNKAVQHIREDKRMQRAMEELPPPDEIEEEIETGDVGRLYKGLNRISSEHKEVLLLRFLEEMSYDEIADVLECQLGTVRSRIHYAKRALKEAMEDTGQ